MPLAQEQERAPFGVPGPSAVSCQPSAAFTTRQMRIATPELKDEH